LIGVEPEEFILTKDNLSGADINKHLHVVFGSPVTRPEKDRDQTGPRPFRTEKYQDRQRP
jgi:hypothetical protein